MTRNRLPSRALQVCLGIAILTAFLGLPEAGAAPAAPRAAAAPSAPAAPALLDPSAPFQASTGTELLTLDAVDLSDSAPLPPLDEIFNQLLSALGLNTGLAVADLGVSHTEANADSNGGAAGVEADRSQALASNLYPLTVADVLDLTDILTVVEATAPPSETVAGNLLEIDDTSPLAPLLQLGVSTATTTANWVSDTECVAADQPVSQGDLDTATATVLAAAGEGGLLNTGDGITSTTSTVDLPATGGPNDQRAVRATSTTQLAGLNLFANALNIGVLTPATLTASATGVPGGATFEYTAPELLNLADNTVIGPDELQALVDQALSPILDALDPLNQLGVDATISMQNDTSGQGTADGTHAEAAFSALSLTITVLGIQTIDLDLLPMRVSVSAPGGGVFCGPGDQSNPLELQKVNSGPAIPGSTFDYTIAVGNVGDCTLDPVSVTDFLSGPAGSTIVSTEPAGATVEPTSDGFKITWANVGPIPPDGRTSLRIRVSVPTNATIGSHYTDRVVSNATCDGRQVSREVVLEEPHVEGPPTGPCNISGSTKSKSHIKVYPGESFIYFVNAYNSGGVPCTNVTITDTLDSRVTFESCSDSCTHNGQDVSWTLATLAPGQSVTLRVQVKVNAGATGTLSNTAVLDTTETGPTTVSVDGPDITDVSVLADANPARTPAVLSRTGGLGPIPASLAALLGVAALGLHRLRRRAIV